MTAEYHEPLLAGVAASLLPDVPVRSAQNGAAKNGATASHGASGVHQSTGDGQHQASHHNSRTLTLWPLVFLIFFEVSGGPFGTEDGVAAAGPLLCVLGFLVLPLVWSVPEALITAEMATAFPENSGYVAWVTAAFGPFWGYQEGLWSWLSGVTDNSLYPVVLAANLQMFMPQLEEGWPRGVFLAGTSLLLSYLNYRGLTVVGHSLTTSALAVVVPFVLLTLLCVPHVQPANWKQVDWPSVDWGTYMNVMFWNLNYWDSVSTLAGEVKDPGRTFPRALLMAVLLVVALYLFPTMAALGVTTDMSDWGLGYYGKVAQQVGGSWLAVWIVVAAAFSSVGQYQAEMASDSYQLQGMAERGFLPFALAKRSKHGTPTLGILLSSLGVLVLSCMDFVSIVELLNAIYCLAELLEFAAFVWLRVAHPQLPRPYKVPLPTWGVVLMLLPAVALLVTVLAMPFVTGQWKTVGATLGAIVVGFVSYPLLQVARRRKWCEFSDLHFDAPNIFGAPIHCSHSWAGDINAIGMVSSDGGLVRGGSGDTLDDDDDGDSVVLFKRNQASTDGGGDDEVAGEGIDPEAAMGGGQGSGL